MSVSTNGDNITTITVNVPINGTNNTSITLNMPINGINNTSITVNVPIIVSVTAQIDNKGDNINPEISANSVNINLDRTSDINPDIKPDRTSDINSDRTSDIYTDFVLLSKKDMDNTDFNGGKVIHYNITDKNGEVISFGRTQPKKILMDNYTKIGRDRVMETTTFNFKEVYEPCVNGKYVKGYVWNNKLQLSFQGKDNNGTIREILRMVDLNSYNILLLFKLKCGTVIKYEKLNN
jgi:hypothetical protein